MIYHLKNWVEKVFSLNVAFIILTAGIFIVTFCIIICTYTSNTSNRLYFSIDKFEIGKQTNITIGKNSDIVYESLVPEFMLVTYADSDSTFRWKIKDRYLNSDSLYYFKVNNNNPNAHTIGANDIITIEEQTLSYDSILAKVKNKENKYFSVRNLLGFGNDTLPEIKSLVYVYRNYIELPVLGKTILNTIDSIQIIILDKYTKWNGTGYTPNGQTNKPEFKLQFYSVSFNQAKHSKIDKKQMFVGNVNYYVKPNVLPTAWGAGHIMLRSTQDNHIEVTFPKAITLCESVEKVRDSLIMKAGGEIVVKQKQSAFSTQNDIYMPAFSRELPVEVCQIEKHKLKNDSTQEKLYISSFGKDTVPLLASSGLLPTMQKLESDFGGNGKVYFRTRELNSGFYLSAYKPLIIVFLLVVIALFLLFGNTDNKGYTDLYNTKKAQASQWYLLLLFLIFTVFLCCKLFIATKLSFSYPFFEKIYSVNILSASLQLLCLFVFISIFNIWFAERLHTRKKMICRLRPLIALVIVLAAYLFLWFLVKPNITSHFSDSIFSSYLHNSAFDSKTCFEDNHATVYRTLSLVFRVLYCIAFIANLLAFIFKEKFHNRLSKVKFSLLPTKFKDKKAFWLLGYWLVAIIIAVALKVIGGNFASAIVTPMIVIGIVLSANWLLCFELPQASNKWWKKIGKELLFLLLVFIVLGLWCGVGMITDMGYITNSIGIFVAFFVFIILKKLPQSPENKEKKKKHFLWTSTISFIVILVLLVMVTIPHMSNFSNVSYERQSRRAAMYVDFNEVQKTGYRYNDSDAEFMVVLSHYMFDNKSDDFMSEHYPLHSSVSTGQSPVVLNDVSFPAAFYSPMKWNGLVFFGLLVALLALVLGFSIGGIKEYGISKPKLHTQMRWRILAVCMWAGTSLYIFASYLGFVPFTGRLIPGFGVDAVGEAIETVLLFAFMGAMAWKINNETEK